MFFYSKVLRLGNPTKKAIPPMIVPKKKALCQWRLTISLFIIFIYGEATINSRKRTLPLSCLLWFVCHSAFLLETMANDR